MRNYSGPGVGDGLGTIPATRLPRSAFDRSFSHKTAIDEAYLYPLFVEEVLPGDSLSIRPSVVFRMTTPLFPFMDEVRMDWHFFYVPFRLVWDNFVKMMGERLDPDDHIDYVVPTVPVDQTPATVSGTLWDYLGMPCNGGTVDMNALYSRSVNLIWNEWYRDENLQDQVVVDRDDGPDDPADYVLLKRGKRKDLYWSALPFAQKGDPVQLPIGSTAPVVGDGNPIGIFTATDPTSRTMINAGTGTDIIMSGGAPGTGPSNILFDTVTGLEADLSSANAASINEMRAAVATQHLLERDARGGTRYRELVLSHFGIQTSDIRLLRPRFLASGSASMEASQVASTNLQVPPAPEVQPGELGAFAHAQSVGRGFHDTFQEHGCVIGLFSIRAEMNYQQGMPRMFNRSTRYDFYWPDLAPLGEQAILSKEIYSDGSGDPDLGTGDYEAFGFQPRYQEYRSRVGQVSGAMRSQAPLSLDVWHLALDFATRPALNDTYIQEAPPIDRVITVVSEPHFKVDAFFRVKAVRPMAKYAVPGLLRF